MLQPVYRFALIINNTDVTAILLKKSRLQWHLIHSWAFNYRAIVNNNFTTEMLEKLSSIGEQLQDYRCSVRVAVLGLSIFRYEAPLNFIPSCLNSLQQFAENLIVKKFGLSKQDITIDFRVLKKDSILLITAIKNSEFIPWIEYLKKCQIFPDIFENGLNLQAQVQQYCSHLETSPLNWSRFNIRATESQHRIDEQVLLAIQLATRQQDTLWC